MRRFEAVRDYLLEAYDVSKTLKNSRSFPDFEEYVVSTSADTPYMILWSKTMRCTLSQFSVPKEPIRRTQEQQYTVLEELNTAYPKSTIHRIEEVRYAIFRRSDMPLRVRDSSPYLLVNMDDPNITMEECIRLEEEKARKRVISLKSGETLSYEPTVSFLNDEIDFKISFDDFDDEDYTVIYDKNSFSYKIISVNDLKMDSENDNDKVNMPLFSSPEPTVSCLNDLDFFKDFENEFSAIAYNNALTSKLISQLNPL
ncbi:hypothetical protein Tco_0017429 [Tanacetum coccineum]